MIQSDFSTSSGERVRHGDPPSLRPSVPPSLLPLSFYLGQGARRLAFISSDRRVVATCTSVSVKDGSD